MIDHNGTLELGQREGNRIDDVVAAILSSRLSGVRYGKLQLTLPAGRRLEIGSGGEIEAALKLNSYALLWRALTRGMIGFADSFMTGEIESPDIGDVMRFFLANFSDFDNAGGGWFRPRAPDRLGHRRRANSRLGSRRNIAAHYDLGNAFYAAWLDEGMNYSSGLFETGEETLAQAQEAKLQLVSDALDLTSGQRVLEIGCGWGSLAERLALKGAEVVAVTVSAQQHDYAKERIVGAGLQDGVDIRFQDYRDIEGTFERIVSVEMIEAVGEVHWPVYFGQLRDRLVPGGRAVLQAITISEPSFESYRRNPDFIQRYIFPGGMLPTVSIMEELARENGFRFEVVRRFGESYARTVRLWRRQFLGAWPRIAKLGFDERFRRMWLYYLTYCEVGFETGLIEVGIYRLRREGD
jgi:cyclopropane-fatty-acyl-phospholipid synthase